MITPYIRMTLQSGKGRNFVAANGNEANSFTPSMRNLISTQFNPDSICPRGEIIKDAISALKEQSIMRGIRGRKIILVTRDTKENVPK